MLKLPDFEKGQGPVLMLNLLKFKDEKHYFEQYLPAFNKVVEKLGISGVKVTLKSNVIANIVAPENASWDAIALVEYPSAEAFKTIVESDVFQQLAEPHRAAATADIQLYMTRISQR